MNNTNPTQEDFLVGIIYNTDKSKLAKIYKVKFDKETNYYIIRLTLNKEQGIYYLDENQKQTETITSYTKAVEYSNSILNN